MKRPALVTALVAIGVGLGFACAEELEDLDPFPCAKDGTCPDGFACLPGTGCKRGIANDRACGPGSECAGGNCLGGICLPPCRSGCAPGRVCAYPPPVQKSPTGEVSAAAHCLADCSTGAPCPQGLECIPLYDGTKGCLPRTAVDSIDKRCDASQDCLLQYGLTPVAVTCSHGVCSKFCSDAGASCAEPGRVCSVAEQPVLSGCLVDCSAGQPCPPGLACVPSPSNPDGGTCAAP